MSGSGDNNTQSRMGGQDKKYAKAHKRKQADIVIAFTPDRLFAALANLTPSQVLVVDSFIGCLADRE